MKISKLSFSLSLFYLLIFSYSSAQNYFQQEVNYTINVSLNDKKHTLSAFETIEYINNSQSELKEIYFHLWPNAYKNNSTALAKQLLDDGSLSFFNAPDSLRGYIDSLDFKVDGEKIKWETDNENIDICKLILNKPLAPGGKINISTPFFVKIPSAKFSRLGHIGQAYFITQWYPKPAVFDNKGWHAIPYLNQGEFYSEFGSFEVSITLPANYVVGATGILQNEMEQQWLDEKASATKRISEFDKSMSFPPSDAETKTLIYKLNNIHDFAWIADKRFHVLKSEVELPKTENKVTTYSLFTNSEADLWKNAPAYIDSALYFYSLFNGDYPYPVCTAVDGTIAAGGGMEYPTITIIGKVGSAFLLEDVIVHEVGHNWFYGILGSNERAYGWMDEGINSFNEQRYFYTKYGNAQKGNPLAGGFPFSKKSGMADLTTKETMHLEAMLSMGNHIDQPIETPAVDFTRFNYGTIMYAKTAVVFEYLKTFLGDSVFNKCAHNYFEAWKFKHPYPEDLKKAFTETSGKNLDWFFDDLINSDKKTDYKICSVSKNKKFENADTEITVYNLKIKNKGQTAVPFTISSLNNNSVIHTAWQDGFKGSKTISIACSGCNKLRINATGEMPDVNNQNNTIRTSGIFKKFEPLSLAPVFKLDNARKTQLMYFPAIGYNVYDGFMAGISLYNTFLEKKKFEFSLTPLYGFNSKYFDWTANFNYTIFADHHFIDRIDLNFNPRSFSYDDVSGITNLVDGGQGSFLSYESLPVSLKLNLKKKNPQSDFQNSFTIRNIYLKKSELIYNHEPDNFSTRKKSYYYQQTIFTNENKNRLDPHKISLLVENGDKYIKSSVELKKQFSYWKVKKGIDIRIFAGTFLNNTSDGLSNFSMSGRNGFGDYLFDDFYFGRSEYEGRASHQMIINDGGFKIYTPIGRSDKWIVSMNASIKIPGLPVRVFMDAGTYADARNAFEGSKSLMYDGGVALILARDVFEIYFPFFYSSDIKQYYALKTDNNKFADKIRFLFNIKPLNPLNLRQKLFDSL